MATFCVADGSFVGYSTSNSAPFRFDYIQISAWLPPVVCLRQRHPVLADDQSESIDRFGTARHKQTPGGRAALRRDANGTKRRFHRICVVPGVAAAGSDTARAARGVSRARASLSQGGSCCCLLLLGGLDALHARSCCNRSLSTAAAGDILPSFIRFFAVLCVWARTFPCHIPNASSPSHRRRTGREEEWTPPPLHIGRSCSSDRRHSPPRLLPLLPVFDSAGGGAQGVGPPPRDESSRADILVRLFKD